MRTIRDLMTEDVRTIGAADVVGTARDILLDGRIHAVPVVDDSGRVVGVVSSLDLVEEWAPEQGIVTVMSDRVRFVDESTTVSDCARVMLAERVHHLVVLDGPDLVGIVSSFDLLRELSRLAPEQLPPAHHEGRGGMVVRPGDIVVVHGKAVGTRERRGVITRTGPDGGTPYFVNWLDDPHDPPHEVMFFPGSDSHTERPTPTERGSNDRRELDELDVGADEIERGIFETSVEPSTAQIAELSVDDQTSAVAFGGLNHERVGAVRDACSTRGPQRLRHDDRRASIAALLDVNGHGHRARRWRVALRSRLGGVTDRVDSGDRHHDGDSDDDQPRKVGSPARGSMGDVASALPVGIESTEREVRGEELGCLPVNRRAGDST